MNNKKVFIINKGGHDYTPAEQYGSLIFLTEGTINVFAVSNMYRSMSEALNGSGPNDYILLCGPPTLQAIACSMFVYKHGRLNLLQYRDGEYRPAEIVMSNLLEV